MRKLESHPITTSLETSMLVRQNVSVYMIGLPEVIRIMRIALNQSNQSRPSHKPIQKSVVAIEKEYLPDHNTDNEYIHTQNKPQNRSHFSNPLKSFQATKQ